MCDRQLGEVIENNNWDDKEGEEKMQSERKMNKVEKEVVEQSNYER